MGFLAYDLALLVLFLAFLTYFLFRNRHNLRRQGIVLLYHAKWGIKFFDEVVKRYRKILIPAKYVSIAIGYVLMAIIVWAFARSTWLYLNFPVTQIIKAPPLMPLIPYFPRLFGLESFFPPLYFTYFLVALLIVMIAHEGSHGIFARLEGFKIKSTGFLFLGPIIGAFVEPDEKRMSKAPKLKQMSVLSAGVFANVLVGALFFLVMAAFFTTAFQPAGVKFFDYSSAVLNLSQVKEVRNASVDGYLELVTENQSYFVKKEMFELAKDKVEIVLAYTDTPAFRSQLRGAILSIDGKPTPNLDALREALSSHKPGDKVKILTAVSENARDSEAKEKEYTLTLAERDGKAFLGIATLNRGANGVIGWLYEQTFARVRNPNIYYTSLLGSFGWFVHYLLWWVVVINLLVAIFNMLPFPALDGGRFFYLTALGLAKDNEKIANAVFKLVSAAIIFMAILMMLKWFIGVAF